jgi:hypothetical protein
MSFRGKSGSLAVFDAIRRALDHRTSYIVDSFGGSPHSHYGLMGETRNNLSRLLCGISCFKMA